MTEKKKILKHKSKSGKLSVTEGDIGIEIVIKTKKKKETEKEE